jgi:hypothetical protein
MNGLLVLWYVCCEVPSYIADIPGPHVWVAHHSHMDLDGERLGRLCTKSFIQMLPNAFMACKNIAHVLF